MRSISVISLISTDAVCSMCYAGRGRGREEGTTLLYKPVRYVPPQRVGFLRRFGLKTVKDFAHFGLESGIVFEGATVVYEHICRLVLNK